MKKYRKWVAALLLLSLLTALTGCMTPEQEDQLDDLQAEAVIYYQNKYGKKPDIEYSYYGRTDQAIPTRTDSVYIVCKDGSTIYYDPELDLMMDDKQADLIHEALEPVFMDQLEDMTDSLGFGTVEVINLGFYTDVVGEQKFYHTRFDGDVAEFLEQEDIYPYAEIFLVCQEGDDWQAAQAALDTLLRENYKGISYVSLDVLSEECYQRCMEENFRHPSSDDEDLYARIKWFWDSVVVIKP